MPQTGSRTLAASWRRVIMVVVASVAVAAAAGGLRLGERVAVRGVFVAVVVITSPAA